MEGGLVAVLFWGSAARGSAYEFGCWKVVRRMLGHALCFSGQGGAGLEIGGRVGT